MKKSTPALVIGGGANALGVIRNLGRNGIDVYCLVEKMDVAVYSRYCKQYFIAPGFIQEKKKLEVFLNYFASTFNTAVVIFPTSDISVLNVCSLLKKIDNYKIIISDSDIIEIMVNKQKFYQSLFIEKIPHPRTIYNSTQYDNLDISFPVFIKPAISEVFNKFFGKKGFRVNSRKELDKYILLLRKYKIDFVIQEIIPGPSKNHFLIDGYFNKDSKLMTVLVRQKLRKWPLTFGNSTICVSVPKYELNEIIDIVVKYLQNLCYRGIFSAEVKLDPRDGLFKLIEVNPRSWQKNCFPSACGINIILMEYQEAIGLPVKNNFNYKFGLYVIDFFNDIGSSLIMFFSKKTSFRELITPYFKKNQELFFALDDLNPFIISIFFNFLKFFKLLKKLFI